MLASTYNPALLLRAILALLAMLWTCTYFVRTVRPFPRPAGEDRLRVAAVLYSFAALVSFMDWLDSLASPHPAILFFRVELVLACLACVLALGASGPGRAIVLSSSLLLALATGVLYARLTYTF